MPLTRLSAENSFTSVAALAQHISTRKKRGLSIKLDTSPNNYREEMMPPLNLTVGQHGVTPTG